LTITVKRLLLILTCRSTSPGRDQHMRRLLLISLATIPLATTPLAGCQFINRDAAVIEPPAEGDVVAASPNGEGEAFAEPTVAAAPNEAAAKPSAVADLISSTDPATRTRQITRSRPDPFAALPIPPTPEPVVVSPVAAAGNGGAATNAGGSAASNATASTRSGGSARAVATVRRPTPPPVRVQPNNAPLVRPSTIAALPSIPQPVIAQTVSVSGVVQMGNEPYAIVRAGNEPERYVRVGDRIAGGSVRVKRIETLAFEPRVILEENGIEVARPIAAEVSGQADAAPAEASPNALPVPPAAVPTAAVPRAQATLPTLPTIPTASPANGIPGSLLLQPADTQAQAILPNLQIEIPQAV
jgi:hypothetical protein